MTFNKIGASTFDHQVSWWRMLDEYEINLLFQRNDLTLADNFKIYEVMFENFSKQLLKSGTTECESVSIVLPDAFFGMIKFNVWKTENIATESSLKFQGYAKIRNSHIINISLHKTKIEVTIYSELGETKILPISTKNFIYLVHRK